MREGFIFKFETDKYFIGIFDLDNQNQTASIRFETVKGLKDEDYDCILGEFNG